MDPDFLIDTHCHIHDRDTYAFALKRQNSGRRKNPLDPVDFTPEKMLTRARENGVKKVICIGTSHEDSLLARDFAAAHENVFWSYGIHPDEASVREKFHLGMFAPYEAQPTMSSPVTTGRASASRDETASASRPVAIGEIGLDYRNGTAMRDAQIHLFEQMLQLAKDQNLPCIFHVRDAFPDFFAILKNFPDTRGVVHSFSDSEENLKKSLNSGFFIGVNGLATFADLPTPPLDCILLETDAPFLTPVPFRGTINEPAHIKDIAQWLSKKLGVSEQEIARQTTENATRIFRI